MKNLSFAALCFVATMGLGCGAPAEDEDFDSFSDELSGDEGKEDDGKGKGKSDSCLGAAFVACQEVTCAADKGGALRTAVLKAVKTAVPKFAVDKDLNVCMKNVRQAKKDLKKDQLKAVCSAYKPYRDACKKEIHAAVKAAFDKGGKDKE